MSQRLIIVGAGMAAAYLLQQLAELGHELQVTVNGDELEACYNRVLLSGVLAGETAATDLGMLDERTPGRAVNFMAGTRVAAVDHEGGTVLTECGKLLAYDKLVFATGASVARPTMADGGVTGVEEFRTLEDARHLQTLARKGGRAVVVGGGLLGLEAAHGLNTLGFETTVVHRQPYLMNRQLDEEGARQLQAELERAGISFCLADAVAELQTCRQVLTGVALHAGTTLPCDLLLFATGISPKASLAARAGLAVDRGILIDPYMRTETAGIYALGECSQLGRSCFGLVAPIRDQARVLARELLGIPGPGFALEHWPTQLKISGIDIYSAGEVDAAGEQLVLRDQRAGVYRRLVLRDGRLVGAVLVGDKRGGNWYSELIASGKNISEFRRGLIFGREVSKAVQLTARAA